MFAFCRLLTISMLQTYEKIVEYSVAQTIITSLGDNAMVRKLLIIGAVMALSLVVVSSVIYASIYNGTVIFTCINADASGSGSHVLDRDNTGIGQEALRVDITDGAGTLIYTLTFSNVLGTFAGGIGDFFYTTAPQFNPITFTLTSLAGNGLLEQVDYVAQGNCVGLPTFVTAGGGCGLPLTAFAVVGEAPLGAQAYYEPGKEATGVVLNPGRYWVLGADESGQYY
jgi:hypothetical protein